MKNYDNLTVCDINNRIPFLKAQNVNGNDIFICPSKNINRAIILIDDVNYNNIELMKAKGHNPACIIQTSKANYQAWISLGLEPLSSEVRKILSKFLAMEYKGDIGSVGSIHYGRLAGFTNRKQKYLTDKGYPFVLCCESSGENAINRNDLIEYANNKLLEIKLSESVNIKNEKIKFNSNKLDSNEAFKTYFKQWEKHTQLHNNNYDLSRGDFAVVCRMIKEGYSRDDILYALLNYSPNVELRKGMHIIDYANRTIDAAEKRCSMSIDNK
jgi:hypothetical protein